MIFRSLIGLPSSGRELAECVMPDDLHIADRHQDPFGWALTQAALLRRSAGRLKTIDGAALSEFLEEWADEMLSAVRSQLVNLMAHAAKVALSNNPDVVGHWRSECIEFHDRIVDLYRPSMRERIDLAALWRRAVRKIEASFADYGEPRPSLPSRCPFGLDQLVDPDLDLGHLIAALSSK